MREEGWWKGLCPKATNQMMQSHFKDWRHAGSEPQMPDCPRVVAARSRGAQPPSSLSHLNLCLLIAAMRNTS